NRDNKADNRTITAAGAKSIKHKVDLAPVLASDDPAVSLVPIKHERFLSASLDQVPVDNRRMRVARRRQGHLLCFRDFPTRSGKAMLRRMHALAGFLSLVVRNKEFDVPSLRIRVVSQHIFIGVKNASGFIVERFLSTQSPGSKLFRERGEVVAARYR